MFTSVHLSFKPHLFGLVPNKIAQAATLALGGLGFKFSLRTVPRPASTAGTAAAENEIEMTGVKSEGGDGMWRLQPHWQDRSSGSSESSSFESKVLNLGKNLKNMGCWMDLVTKCDPFWRFLESKLHDLVILFGGFWNLNCTKSDVTSDWRHKNTRVTSLQIVMAY